MKRVICIGGGAASFFFATHLASLTDKFEIQILEQGKSVLQKVRISGGGRCNVTHNCFDPVELVKNYPRGGRELLGPFYHFGPEQTMSWFSSKGVPLKIESDGRVFPVSNNSESIIEILTSKARGGGVQVDTKSKVKNIHLPTEEIPTYRISLLDGSELKADFLFVGCGSSKAIWQVLESRGHTIVKPIPSLFTFQIRDARLKGLAGISFEDVKVTCPTIKKQFRGPLLVTHKGLSGPAILGLSAFGARKYFEINYAFDLIIDHLPEVTLEELDAVRNLYSEKEVGNNKIFNFPKRYWRQLIDGLLINPATKMNSLSHKSWSELKNAIKSSNFRVVGQNRFKEEFVTAGGVDLKEIDFKRFSSKIMPNAYLVGEVLNIDAVTGGFNFQAAWTGAFLAAEDLASRA